MKALLLVGGQGTRLRPLTIHAPKSIVPIFNRPFLHYQLDLIKQVPEIDEVILSLNYQPDRIREVFGDGTEAGIKLRYVVEPTPLGTAGGVRYAAQGVRDTLVVFNGDVLTQVDLGGLIDFHRGRRARATIVLTPVENPTAYGLVETDPDSNIRRFLEKPKPEEITCNTINAGIYVLEPETFDRIPPDVAWSIERSFFPSFIERGETFLASIYRDYWIDIGTPEKYMQVHRDIMDGRYSMPPFHGEPGMTWIAPTAHIDASARLEGPLFVDEGCVVKAGARLGPYTVLGRDCQVDEDANVAGAIAWAGTRIGREADVTNTIIGRACTIGRNAQLRGGVLGDHTSIADYTRL
ncbi:MAG TPA: NDP-sugar synthase [Vicinamibacterales bacterium]|nr:NDP-sugar synthase [Vicinamibacterales bacterium]